MNELDTRRRLGASPGALRVGSGMACGVIALGLALRCLHRVLAFHGPQVLTTPGLRPSDNVDAIRQLLLGSMVLAGGLPRFNIHVLRTPVVGAVLHRADRTEPGAGWSLSAGGQATSPPHPCIGRDGFILNLPGSMRIIVCIDTRFATCTPARRGPRTAAWSATACRAATPSHGRLQFGGRAELP